MEIKELHQLFINSSGLTTDSRQIEKDSIFFALKGDNFDGNLFAQSAIEKGSNYAVVDNKEYCLTDKHILVEDVLKCLQQLAKYHRSQLNCPVLGITGTNGKTTTKELITTVIETKYKTVSTKGNLNNHIGVPLTLLSAQLDTEFLIEGQFIRGIKKSSRTGLMLLDKDDNFIMYFSKNSKVRETNIFTVI